MTEKRDRDSSIVAHPYPDYIRGSERARVQLLEYGDYQCPHCLQAHKVVLTILEEFGDQVQFIFRYFPLIELHPQAQHAAEAAEAAGSQNKFWQMHDRLLTAPQALDDVRLVEQAIALRLNVNQFLKEISGNCHVDRITEHIAQGKNDGVHISPAFFINQQRFDGDWSQSDLIQAIKTLIQQSRRGL